MTFARKLATGLALVAVAALPAAASAGEVLDRVTKNKVLVMATDAAYPPQSFQKEDGTFHGFDIDVGKAIAARLGVRLKLVTPAWEIIVAGKWGARWDISVGSMTPTAKRAQVLSFPAVYYFTPASFAVHKDNTSIKTVADLNGKTIGACGGCTYEYYLQKDLTIDAEGAPPFKYQVTPGEIRTYESDTNVFDDLRIGDGKRLDGLLSALPTIEEAIKNGYPFRVVGDPAFYEPLSVAVDKHDPEFTAKLKRIVEAMHSDGSLSKLSKKWYGVDLTKAATGS
jgi:polar amino acid transport system substrate-binding protein